jgi:hypothetical protein
MTFNLISLHVTKLRNFLADRGGRDGVWALVMSCGQTGFPK